MLKEVMGEKKISQAELGKMSGVSRQTISGFLNGKQQLTEDSKKKIAKALDTPISELFEVDEPEESDLDIKLVDGADTDPIVKDGKITAKANWCRPSFDESQNWQDGYVLAADNGSSMFVGTGIDASLLEGYRAGLAYPIDELCFESQITVNHKLLVENNEIVIQLFSHGVEKHITHGDIFAEIVLIK